MNREFCNLLRRVATMGDGRRASIMKYVDEHFLDGPLISELIEQAAILGAELEAANTRAIALDIYYTEEMGHAPPRRSYE